MDVSYFAVLKSKEFLVVAGTNGVVTNATLTVSTGSGPWELSPADTNAVLWRYENHFASEAALEAAFPSGVFYNPVSYTMNMYGRNDGLRSASLSFFLAFLRLKYPVTPQISNFPLRKISTRHVILNFAGITWPAVQLLSFSSQS